jgi:TolB-like protein
MRMSFYHELKRRNVFRVGAAYIVAAWLLIQVAETIFPLFGFGDAPARITVILLAIGFPLFLLFSWVFELTPEGLKKEKDIDRTVSVTRKTGKQLDRVIILLLALGLGYFAFDKFVLDPARDAVLVEETAQQTRSDVLVESYGDKSIAVLPFVNMSDDARNEYFSDGISEELLNLLAQIPELRVISRSSSFSFKGKDIAIPEVAKQLNVAHVLEGSVRKAGNRVRITAQLIDGRSDTHLWSDTYDRELDDIFAVQDEIAAAISVALKIKLKLVAGEMMQPEAIKTANTDAYVAYLQGRELIRGRGWVNMEGAIRLSWHLP